MDDLTKKIPNLVAHRGYSMAYPENSLSAFQAAVASGCLYLELDVQLSADEIPLIIHDDNLLRTGSKNVNILESHFTSLQNQTIGESERLGEKYSQEKLISLSNFAQWLGQYPDVKVFVELKEESIARFGNKTVFEKTLLAIESVKSQCYLISFDAPFLFYAKQYGDYPIGYVLHKYDEASRRIAEQLQPEILICNYEKIPDEDSSLWLDSWEWFLYEICEKTLAEKWLKRGVKYIETMDIKPMMEAFSHDL